MTRKKSLIERANDINFFDVLKEFFEIDLPRTGTPYASHCPFTFEHPKPEEKKFRSYPDSNSGYCFVMHGSLTPVKLIALRKGISWRKAAEFLLDHYGLLRPRPYPERWAELQAARQAREEAPEVGDTSDIVEALRTSLAAHPAYTEAQYDSEYLRRFDRLLRALDDLIERGAPEEVIRQWFQIAKARMIELLDGWD